MKFQRLIFCSFSAILSTSVASCGGDESSRTLAVPADFPTIQAAVNDARTGDVVLVSPGTYRESVKVVTDGIVVRGVDRNSVVLDGEHKRPNGIYVGADNVTIQNLTVHSYTQNGVVFNGIDAVSGGKGADPNVVYGVPGHSLDGYRVQYVTAYNNGLYGIYAFASVNGLVENSYVSGQPDSGLYIGQCKPCNVIVRGVTAERNAIGYYGTNASGNVYVLSSKFLHNRLGVAPNSQKAEELAPQQETYVVGNLITDNDDPAAPAIPNGFFGGGIGIGGGTKNVILRNKITDHLFVGIALTMLNDFLPRNNRIEENVLSNNKFDLLYSPNGASGANGNCFINNSFTTSQPDDIETVMSCSTQSSLSAIPHVEAPVAPPRVDYQKIPAPGNQPTMPMTERDAVVTPVQFVKPNLDSIEVPQ